MSGSILVGILAGAGTYMILQRGIVRITLGFVLLGHAANVLLILSGGIRRRGVPIAGVSGVAADPLPQAFALTAIVIGFAVVAFLLALAHRAHDVLGDDDLDQPGTGSG